MAEQGAVALVLECIDTSQSFVVEAGAGAGKTRALVEVIEHLVKERRVVFTSAQKRIACITYTNVAKNEIIERLHNDPVVFVSTIHEFIWSLIAPYQAEIKREMLVLNQAAKEPVDQLELVLSQRPAVYGQYGRRLDLGELDHDDVLTVASNLFATYPMILRVAADQYPIIFVDEYQDTSPQVIAILLDSFVNHSRKPVVGFFGDEMQQIYDDGTIGLTARDDLRTITMLDNYRCSVKVIEVVNKLRQDIVQVPSDANAPGNVHLLHAATATAGVHDLALRALEGHGWTTDNTKILMLTQKSIAKENGFLALHEALKKRGRYAYDRFMKRDDEFGDWFGLVEDVTAAYGSKRYGHFLELLGRSGMRISKHGDKLAIASEVAELNELRHHGTVGDVRLFIKQSPLLPVPRKVEEFEAALHDPDVDEDRKMRYQSFFDALLMVKYTEIISLRQYVESKTPFSTQHGVKGAEFENVLVVIDDKAWTKWKLGAVLAGGEKNQSRYEKSRRLLYVCFSRARDGLAVLFVGPGGGGELSGAQELLGVAEVIALSE